MLSNAKSKLIYFHVHRSPYQGMTSLYFTLLFTSNDVSEDNGRPQDTMRLWSSDFAKMAMIHMSVYPDLAIT